MQTYKLPTLIMAFFLCSSAAASIICHHAAEEGELPFIQTANQTVVLRVDSNDQGCKGVHFSHSAENPSPHVTHTHVESAYHVFAGTKWGDSEKLSSVIRANPLFHESILALCVEVEPSLVDVIKRDDIWGMQGEEYLLSSEVQPEEQELVITKASLQEVINQMRVLLPFHMILVKVKEGEEYSSKWPYMTNDAVAYLMGLQQVKAIALNTPSIDREVDAGVTSNHKRVFTSPNHLVIEMADFSGLENKTNYFMSMALQGREFNDCDSLHLNARPLGEFRFRRNRNIAEDANPRMPNADQP